MQTGTDRHGLYRHRLDRVNLLASRVAGGLLLLGSVGMVVRVLLLSFRGGATGAGSVTGAESINLGLQLVGTAVVCSGVIVLLVALFVTLRLVAAERLSVAVLGGLSQVGIGLWLVLYALRTPLSWGGLLGWLLILACGVSFCVAGGSRLGMMYLDTGLPLTNENGDGM